MQHGSDRFLALGLVAVALATACGSPARPAAEVPTAPTAVASTSSAAPSLRWFHDQADAAFTEGKKRDQLVFVDLWAPWCHTCLSMQQQVLLARVVPELQQLVPLAIDTERADNEGFLRKYPVGVWPTFYVVDPRSGEVRGRWLGGATPEQLGRFLRDAASGQDTPSALLREADGFAANKKFGEAAERYRAALAAAPRDWPRRADALVALIASLRKERRFSDCLSLALAEGAALPPSVASVDFASTAATCADQAPGDENAKTVRALLAQTLARDCQTTAPGVSVDDQADACGNLREVRVALGDTAGARRASEQALRVIAAGSAGAGPEAQAIYDWERTQSLVHLGRTAEAIALLLERERALPRSYNPPHYLARLYRDTSQWALGLAAIERALAKAYGPRRLGFLGIKADLLKGAGKLDEARATLQEQLAGYRALPPGQQLPDAAAAVQKKLDALPSAAER